MIIRLRYLKVAVITHFHLLSRSPEYKYLYMWRAPALELCKLLAEGRGILTGAQMVPLGLKVLEGQCLALFMRDTCIDSYRVCLWLAGRFAPGNGDVEQSVG